MQLSQKLANFSKGDADLLRKAMGKKIFSLLEKLKPKFINGGIDNGYDEEILEKIWKDWEAFASYAFNKSHSTCYQNSVGESLRDPPPNFGLDKPFGLCV